MSQTTPAKRGYGITKADLEASRLVFVSLRDSHPKRKVAVPVPDGYSWQEFLEQVKSKLRLADVGSVYFASTGERINSLDGLEDIDELYVEEAKAGVPEANISQSTIARKESVASDVQISPSPAARVHRQPSVPDGKLNHSMEITAEVIDEDQNEKYVKRSTLLKRMAQRIFPESFTPGLPITTARSVGSEEKSGKKRRRRNRTQGRTLILLMVGAVVASFVTMTYLYWQLVSVSNSV